MKHIIQFQIYKGEKQYVAAGLNEAIFTQGKTLDELAKNIQEAVEVHFSGEDLAAAGYVAKPAILANFELPLVHA